MSKYPTYIFEKVLLISFLPCFSVSLLPLLPTGQKKKGKKKSERGKYESVQLAEIWIISPRSFSYM